MNNGVRAACPCCMSRQADAVAGKWLGGMYRWGIGCCCPPHTNSGETVYLPDWRHGWTCHWHAQQRMGAAQQPLTAGMPCICEHARRVLLYMTVLLTPCLHSRRSRTVPRTSLFSVPHAPPQGGCMTQAGPSCSAQAFHTGQVAHWTTPLPATP